MKTEQIMQALSAISRDVSIKMRRYGDWYVTANGVERKEGAVLMSGCVSEKTPERAVQAYLEWATDGRYYLVINASTDIRRPVSWNGFMWADVREEER